MFNYVLDTHGLKLDQDGQPRTTYSLRHYALQTRLNKSGGKVNIYDLAGKMAEMRTKIDLVNLDELGYLPFSPSGGALLFHLLSKLDERTSVVSHDQPQLQRMGAGRFGDATMTTALLDRLTHRCRILEYRQRRLSVQGQLRGSNENHKGGHNVDQNVTTDKQ